MGCCTGEKIDFEDLRTPEQKAIMAMLGPIIQSQMKTGATPYSGMLSAPYDVGQIAAMNTMMGLGGYGGYTAPQIPTSPLQAQGPDPIANITQHGPFQPINLPDMPFENWWEYDPYSPRRWKDRPERNRRRR